MPENIERWFCKPLCSCYKYNSGPKLTVVSFLSLSRFPCGLLGVCSPTGVWQGSRGSRGAAVDTCAAWGFHHSGPQCDLTVRGGRLWRPFVVTSQQNVSVWVRALHKLWSLSSCWDINSSFFFSPFLPPLFFFSNGENDPDLRSLEGRYVFVFVYELT